MKRVTERTAADKELVQDGGIAEALNDMIRSRLREMIETILEDELEAVLGAGSSERTAGRRGYRHGSRERPLTCQAGTTTLRVPRARIFDDLGGTLEHRSGFIPHYERRTEAVNEALLGAYVMGTSTRKVSKALSSLWKSGPLSRSSVSRLAPKLRARHQVFSERSVADRSWIYVHLDAIALRVRLAGKVGSVPVMAALGGDETGHEELLTLSLRTSEGTDAWEAVCGDLRERGVSSPELVIIDGSKGLRRAVDTVWPDAACRDAWFTSSVTCSPTRPLMRMPRSRLTTSRSPMRRARPRRAMPGRASCDGGRSRFETSCGASKRAARSCWPSPLPSEPVALLAHDEHHRAPERGVPATCEGAG